MATMSQINEAVYRSRFEDQMSAGANAAAKAMDRLADSVQATEEQVRRAGPTLESINRRLDEDAKLTAAVERANRRHEATLKTLRVEREAGNITAEREAALTERAGRMRDLDIQRARRQAEAMKQAYGEISQAQSAMTASLESVRRQYDPAYAALARYGKESERVGAILRQANVTDAERVRILAAVADAYDPITRAAKQAAEAQEQAALANRKMIEQARAAQTASNAQADINGLFGIGRSTNSASASAAVFQEQADEMERLATRARALREAVEPAAKAQRVFTEQVAEADELLARGAISYETHAVAVKQYHDNMRMASGAMVSSEAAAKKMTNTLGLTKAQMQALSPQINDVITGLAMGQPAMMIFTQQSGHFVQALQAGGAELPRFSAGVLAAGASIAALVAGFVGVIVAVQSYRSEVKEVERLNSLFGGTAGMTTAALMEQAEAIGDLTGVSSAMAREIQNVYLSTRKIGGSVLADLAAATKGWALATGQEVEAARDDLAKLFVDPSRAVDELTDRYGIFDDAQRQIIKNYQAQGDLE